MKYTDRFDSTFEYYNQDGKIDWRYAKAQAMAESALNPHAVSHVGAKGLTQFMPETWDEVMAETPYADPSNPEDSIKAQSLYMRQLLTKFGGDLRKATAAYNAGPGRVAKLVAKHGDYWAEYAPKETKDYVPRIEKLYEQFCREDS
jgi:soluble lytic murein transglycosylase-like protein